MMMMMIGLSDPKKDNTWFTLKSCHVLKNISNNIIGIIFLNYQLQFYFEITLWFLLCLFNVFVIHLKFWTSIFFSLYTIVTISLSYDLLSMFTIALNLIKKPLCLLNPLCGYLYDSTISMSLTMFPPYYFFKIVKKRFMFFGNKHP